MKEFDLIFKIECVSEFIANTVRQSLEKELKRLYRDIIVKSKVIEHPNFKTILDLIKSIN